WRFDRSRSSWLRRLRSRRGKGRGKTRWAAERFDIDAGELFQFGQALLALGPGFDDEQSNVEEGSLCVDQFDEGSSAGGVSLARAAERLLGAGKDRFFEHASLSLDVSHGDKSGDEGGGAIALRLPQDRLALAQIRPRFVDHSLDPGLIRRQ